MGSKTRDRKNSPVKSALLSFVVVLLTVSFLPVAHFSVIPLSSACVPINGSCECTQTVYFYDSPNVGTITDNTHGEQFSNGQSETLQGTCDTSAGIQVQANPNSGYAFIDWSGAATGTSNPTTASFILLDGSASITANYGSYYGMNQCSESGCPVSVYCSQPTGDPIYTDSSSRDQYDSCFLGAGLYFNLNPMFLKAEAMVESGITPATWNWWWPTLPCGYAHSYGILQMTPDCVQDVNTGQKWFAIYDFSSQNPYGVLPSGYSCWSTIAHSDSTITSQAGDPYYNDDNSLSSTSPVPNTPSGDMSSPPLSSVSLICDNGYQQADPDGNYDPITPVQTSANGGNGYIIDVSQDSSNSALWPQSAYNPAYAIWATAYYYRSVMIGSWDSSANRFTGQVYSHGWSSCSIVQQWYIAAAAYNAGWYGITSCSNYGSQGQGYVNKIMLYYFGYQAQSSQCVSNGGDACWTQVNSYENPYSNYPNSDTTNPFYGCNEYAYNC